MFLTGSSNKKADKTQSILHDSSILTDGPVELPNSHKPFLIFASTEILSGKSLRILEIYLSFSYRIIES